jgi:hypothetical protein
MDIITYRVEDKTTKDVTHRHYYGNVVDFLVYHSNNAWESSIIINVYHVKEGEEEERIMEFLKNNNIK